MSIRVALSHKTVYRYDRLVNLSPQVIRLRPAPHCRTPVPGYSVRILPENHFINWQQDPQSNYLARVVMPDQIREFSVEIDLVAEMTVINPFDFFLEPSAEQYPFDYEAWLAKELAPYLEREAPGPLLRHFLSKFDRSRRRSIDMLVALNQEIQKLVKYTIRLEPGVQSCEETLERRNGSCRDSAWLMVQILRHLGIAARFASGYLIQLTADEKPLDGPSGPEKDFTDLHAWAEAYLPGAGWVGFDPTSGLLAGEGHIPLACTPDPTSAAPITGAVDECEVEFSHHMEVRRIHEDPRVTKPYAEETWQQIETLGGQVDKELEAGDVRLTMGGEPTFVSIDDMDGPEWNVTALGPAKRLIAGELICRLRDRFAPGGLLHYGQGKWYPGESLPRWALSCYWRKDGHPVWNDPGLIADERVNYGFNDVHARHFATALAERLAVDPQFVIPGYEDAWYYLWKERRLPTNVDPHHSNLKNPEERARLARVFENGLQSVTGFALPLRRDHSGGESRWKSGPWFLRPERMYLAPGDSPMGYRLPVDSLPWVTAADYPYHYEQDPLAERRPLPFRPRFRQQYLQAGAEDPSLHLSLDPVRPGRPLLSEQEQFRIPSRGESAAWVTRTALCVEPREGRLHVFMPPAPVLEDYLELVSHIEETAEAMEMPVIIEGYHPPADHRLKKLGVTPDPGVIEVNIHPAHSWKELSENTRILYEEARQCRLATEKFMLDGRHIGTGGGNHVILGGETPADSPILRRPDLLKSLVAYWHNHPSLSYIFSGQFLGPTSQAPRIDEARNDSLYELDIAFRQIRDGAETAPWLVDRIFRHLLTDVTGNTHRSEFCVDKLFSPDSGSGRLGLLEFRAFEMPPHSRMSLTQQLLLRSLVARFWKEPYRQQTVRWGTELHDRFMLPHFIEQDFGDVIGELNRYGYAFHPEWFAPHAEFRFPVYGRVSNRDIEIELRQAIEPWHVMGEEPGGGGTVRYVDSSVERLQIKVNGMVDTRHAVACNGIRVPLKSTGRNGEYVAGIRFRAWQPPVCLHPTIPVHSPLVFDLVDEWAGRAVGGCTYHVMHPGGRNYEQFPVNANEAESRRLARFQPFGHTPGPLAPGPAEMNPEFPLTLDLRRFG